MRRHRPAPPPASIGTGGEEAVPPACRPAGRRRRKAPCCKEDRFPHGSWPLAPSASCSSPVYGPRRQKSVEAKRTDCRNGGPIPSQPMSAEEKTERKKLRSRTASKRKERGEPMKEMPVSVGRRALFRFFIGINNFPYQENNPAFLE